MELKTIEKAARWDLFVQQGSTWGRVLNFHGTPIDNVEFRGQIRRSHADPTVLATLAFTKLADNRLHIYLTAAETAALPAERMVHDIEVHTLADAWVARLFEGRVTVTPEVTR